MITQLNVPTVIAETTHLQGQIVFSTSSLVLGVLEGEIISQSLERMQIGKTGFIHGSIASRGPIVIEGKVEGRISSDTKICLMPSAKVKGDMKAPIVDIRAGAIFDGDLAMPSNKTRNEKPKLRRVA